MKETSSDNLLLPSSFWQAVGCFRVTSEMLLYFDSKCYCVGFFPHFGNTAVKILDA